LKRTDLFQVVVGVLWLAGCSPAASAPVAADPQAAQIPAGWTTHTSQQCEYAISTPSEMEITSQNPYSQLINFKVPDPDAGARSFLYVSVIAPDIQERVRQGVYQSEVHNYVPEETDALLNMQVGEIRPLREFPNAPSGSSYQRQADTLIGGQPARTYENVAPWEFPQGTKEIRYYATLDGCMYLIGGYMDTTGSAQPGAISEDLFHQIIATVQLMP
jgi:hypothetical protein